MLSTCERLIQGTRRKELPTSMRAEGLASSGQSSTFAFLKNRATKRSVTLRHAVAFALTGWCLVLPPIDPRGPIGLSDYGLETQLPLLRWTVDNTFESEKVCKVSLLSRQEELERELADYTQRIRHGAVIQEHDSFRLHQMQVQWAFGKCVSADDPRLKEK
jgi:hypothetical protein